MGGSRHGDRTDDKVSRRARGVSAVELAMLAPFLILLLFGVIDTSSLIIQNIDVQHAAAAGGRYAAVSAGDTTAIGILVCATLTDHSETTVELAGAAGDLGDHIQITVRKQANVLTGLTDWAFNPPVNLISTWQFRIERVPVGWTDGTYSC